MTLQFSSLQQPPLYYLSWFCGSEIWAELNWAVLPFLLVLMWVICWYSCAWSGLAGLRWLYSYVSLWAGIAGSFWKVLEGQALLRSLTSHLVAQRSQNKGPKRQEVEAAYLLGPGNRPSISPAIFYWSRKSWSRDRFKGFSWIQRSRPSMGREAESVWPSLVCPRVKCSSPRCSLAQFFNAQTSAHMWPLTIVWNPWALLPIPPSDAITWSTLYPLWLSS